MAAFAHKITLFFFSATCIRIFQHCRPARPGLLSLLLRSVAEVLHRGFTFLHGGLSVYPY